MGALFKSLGHFGELTGILGDIYASGRDSDVTSQDISDAIDLLMRSGYDVDVSKVGAPKPPPFQPPRQPTGRPKTQRPDPRSRRTAVGRVPTIGDRRRRLVDLDDRELGVEDIEILPTISAPQISDGSEMDVFSRMIETPESSNVYAYGYDHTAHILYVQYKAGSKPISYTPKVNSCSGDEYQMGHRPHIPGPIYAYGSARRPVPEYVFEDMKAAASKGEFVWQYLRVCGSLWEHQYPYILVSPSTVGGSVYVPRKAIKDGFRVRSVAQVGNVTNRSVRRPFDRSALSP